MRVLALCGTHAIHKMDACLSTDMDLQKKSTLCIFNLMPISYRYLILHCCNEPVSPISTLQFHLYASERSSLIHHSCNI